MTHAVRRRGRLFLVGLLACVLPLSVSWPAAARDRLRPPRTVQAGAWWYDVMRIAKAHTMSTGKGATIALIDSGIDLSVPELRGADIRLRYDCHGRRAKRLSGPLSAHGTTMATLLVGNGHGNGPGGAGVRGIAPDATVLAYDDDLRPAQENIQCPTEAIDRFVDDAIRQGADVISVAATMGPHVVPAFRKAIEAGVVVVAAGGADDVGGPGSVFPADLRGAVSVYAVDRFAKPWKHQRWRGAPVISAPGVYVGTGGFFGSGWTSNAWSTGTSAATTITSGALALVQARYPNATGNQLIQQLVHYTGGNWPYTWNDEYGFGIVSPVEMLRTDPAQWPDENPLGKVVPDAVRTYPMSASTLVGPSPGAKPVAEGSGARRPSGKQAAAASTGSGPSVPAWAWPAGALVVAAAAGAALVTRRRRRTDDEGPVLADERRGA